MRLPKPSAPFSPVPIVGESVTIETEGKVLVLPTGDPDILPAHNEYVLSSRRLSLEDYPWGGVSDFPDYAPGTLYTPTDGIYLTDLSGTNSTKTLTAGKLKELSLLSVDTVNHSITEEFIVANTAESNNPTVIDACDSAEGWSALGFTITSTDGILSASGNTSASGSAVIQKSFSLDLSPQHIISFKIRSSVSCKAVLYIYSGAYYRAWYDRIQLTADTWATINIPIRAPTGSSELYPSAVSWASGDYANITQIKVGISGGGNSVPVVISIDNITADTAKTATIEAHVPDNLSATSLSLYTHNGTDYQLASTHSLDSTYSQVSQTSANFTYPDSTKFDDVYGTGLGRAVFPKSSAGATVNGSSGSITYSNNLGTDKRIGLKVDLPPSDNGRTNFNKVRLKLVINYTDTVGNIVPDLSGNGNHGTIVGGVTKLNDGELLFDGSSGYIHFGNPLHLQLVQYNDFAVAFRYKHVVGGKRGNLFDHYYFKSTPYSSTLQAKFMAYNGTAWFNLYSIVDIYDGNEHFIIYNKSGNTINLYVDGVLRDSQTSNLPFVNGTLTKYLVFGRYNEAASTYTNGSLLSFSVLTRNPTALEIAGEINPADTILTVCPTVSNMGSTTHEFADSTNTSYGLQNLSKPWIALYDPTSNLIDFYLFTYRPKNLEFKRDESGTIYEVKLYPGNGLIYHGQITFSDLTRDTNSDSVPDFLEADVNGSVTKFLQNYSMVI